MVRSTLDILLKDFNICHICGKGNVKPEFNGKQGYKQFEYINEEQAHIFAMSDIVVSRAGATVLFELLALKKPNLLIPLSKAASRGDQILNAESFRKQGYSMVLYEENMNEDSFIKSVNELYKERVKYIEAMKAKSAESGIAAVLKLIEKYSGRP